MWRASPTHTLNSKTLPFRCYFGRRNALLLIGLPADKREVAEEILHENCRQRVEFIAVPLESAPLPLPTPTPITVGGATIFALEVEHYEEI